MYKIEGKDYVYPALVFTTFNAADKANRQISYPKRINEMQSTTSWSDIREYDGLYYIVHPIVEGVEFLNRVLEFVDEAVMVADIVTTNDGDNETTSLVYDPEQYRQFVSDSIDSEKKPKYLEFVAPAKGKILPFKIDLEDIVDTTAQLQMLRDGDISYMIIHDKYHQVKPPRYSLEEATVIVGILMYVKKKTMLPKDLILRRIWGLKDFTAIDVMKAVQDDFTEEETTELMTDLMDGSTPELIQVITELGI